MDRTKVVVFSLFALIREGVRQDKVHHACLLKLEKVWLSSFVSNDLIWIFAAGFAKFDLHFNKNNTLLVFYLLLEATERFIYVENILSVLSYIFLSDLFISLTEHFDFTIPYLSQGEGCVTFSCETSWKNTVWPINPAINTLPLAHLKALSHSLLFIRAHV